MAYSREESVKKRRARKQTGIALRIHYSLQAKWQLEPKAISLQDDLFPSSFWFTSNS
jgi:hypothetical protein